MFFTVRDYVNFRRLAGKYDVTKSSSQLGSSFRSHLPVSVTEHLEVGDVIFTFNKTSVLSWVVCYFTKGVFSHVALVAAPGMIAESDATGTGIRKFDSLYGKGKYLLAVKNNLNSDERLRLDNQLKMIPNLNYAWKELFANGLEVIACKYPNLFRTSYIWDGLILATLLDVFVVSIIGLPVFLVLFGVYLLLVGIMWVSWRFFRRTPTGFFYPDGVLEELRSKGAILYLSGQALNESFKNSGLDAPELPEVVLLGADNSVLREEKP